MRFNYLLIWQGNFAVAILIALGKPEVAGGGVVKALEGKRVLRVGVVHGKGGLIHERVLVPALSLPDDPAHTDTPVGVTVDPDAQSIETDGNDIVYIIIDPLWHTFFEKNKDT